jgi:hypothetical protein
MIDSGVVERWQVGDQARVALERLKDEVAGVIPDRRKIGELEGDTGSKGWGVPIRPTSTSRFLPSTPKKTWASEQPPTRKNIRKCRFRHWHAFVGEMPSSHPNCGHSLSTSTKKARLI